MCANTFLDGVRPLADGKTEVPMEKAFHDLTLSFISKVRGLGGGVVHSGTGKWRLILHAVLELPSVSPVSALVFCWILQMWLYSEAWGAHN